MDKPDRKFPVETTLLGRMKDFIKTYPSQFWLLFWGMLALTMGAGSMIGPLLGGFLNDTFSPKAIWYGGGAAGFLGSIIFLILATRTKKPQFINRRH